MPVIQYWIRWKYWNGWWSVQELGECNHGLFEWTIIAFSWTDWKKLFFFLLNTTRDFYLVFWVYLYYITKKNIGFPISFLDIFKELFKTKGIRLELKVCVLSSRDLIQVYISITRFHCGSAFKWCIQSSSLLPVCWVFTYIVQIHAYNKQISWSKGSLRN